MKKVLFIAGTSLSPFNTMLTIAKHIQKHSNEYEPLFILSTSQFEVKVKDLEAVRIDYKRFYSNSSVNFVKKNESLLRKIYKNLQKTSLFLYLNSIRIYKQLVSNYKKIDEICKDMDIQAIFIPCDRCGGYENLFLKYAKENSIKSFVFPYAYTDPVSRLDRRFDKDELCFNVLKSPWINFMIEKKYPKQVFKHDGLKSLFYPADYVLATSKFGSLALDPWNVGGSGMIDYICLQGEQEKDKSISFGIKDNLYTTGHPEHDLLYESFLQKDRVKNELINKFSLDSSKKIVILALPQWYENKVLNREDSDKYHKLLVQSILSNDVNLLISLHPKMEVEYYKKSLGDVNILEQSLSSCLSIADVFVSGFVGTSTWAMLLGIPTVLMNEFDFKYEYIASLKGILKTDRETFAKEVNRLLADESYYKLIKSHQDESSKYFAKFDGNVNQRFLELIKE